MGRDFNILKMLGKGLEMHFMWSNVEFGNLDWLKIIAVRGNPNPTSALNFNYLPKPIPFSIMTTTPSYCI